MPNKYKVENSIKTGDLVFLKSNAWVGASIAEVGIAVWLMDPMFKSQLFFVDVCKRRIRMTSFSCIDSVKLIVRPAIAWHQVVTRMLEEDGKFASSTDWVVDALNRCALSVREDHTPDSLYDVLVNGFEWKVI